MTTFSIYWKVAGVEISKDFSTRRNIKKPVLFPRYQGSVGSHETVLAYIGSREIDPKSNLNIIRTEDSLVQNSKSAFSTKQVWEGSTGYTSARYFLLTDVVGNYVAQTPEPFYWKHVLPSGDIDPNSVAILDSDLNEVDENSYITEQIESRDATDSVISGSYESCSVYSNYINSYDESTGEVVTYFVRYSVSGSSHYELLNPQRAFTEATFDDISSVTGALKTWRKVYLVATGPTLFTVTTPSSSTVYYLTPLERSRIIVREPVDRSDESPWFVNIANGAFSIVKNSVTYTYSVPEFSAQTFSPISPYKVEVEELAEYLRPDLIKVDKSPLKVDSSLYKMDILIKNAQNQTLYALTTDTSKEGNYYEEGGERVFRTLETDNAWIVWDSNGIAGWSSEESFIHLQREYPDTRYFYVTYYYEETGFEYTSLNVNPIFEEDYNGQFYVVYITPKGGSNESSQSASINYLRVDRSGRIISASQDGSGGTWDLASTISVGEQNMYYSLSGTTTGSTTNLINQNFIAVNDYTGWPATGIVTWLDYSGTRQYQPYNQLSDNKIYFENSFVLPGEEAASTEYRLHSFVEPYTSSSDDNRYQYLVLAEVHADSSSKVGDLSVIDLRVPGGVIKKKYAEEALATDPRAIWARPEMIKSRGQPIPGDSVAVIKVPYTLLKEFGGDFTKEQVEAIIAERHLGIGVIPVVLFHGAIPEIEDVSSTTDSVIVSWSSEGNSFSYNIYYSSTKDGPWTLANPTPFVDYEYNNSYTISGLTSGLIYYITVTSIDSNGVEGPRGDPWGIKTRIS